MKGYLLSVGIISSLMTISIMIDASPTPFNREMVSKLKSSVGRLSSFAKQIAKERENMAMDRSLDNPLESVEHLEKEVKHMKAIEHIVGIRDRLLDILHPMGKDGKREALAPRKAGNAHQA